MPGAAKVHWWNKGTDCAGSDVGHREAVNRGCKAEISRVGVKIVAFTKRARLR